jgi:hypothetical protein
MGASFNPGAAHTLLLGQPPTTGQHSCVLWMALTAAAGVPWYSIRISSSDDPAACSRRRPELLLLGLPTPSVRVVLDATCSLDVWLLDVVVPRWSEVLRSSTSTPPGGGGTLGVASVALTAGGVALPAVAGSAGSPAAASSGSSLAGALMSSVAAEALAAAEASSAARQVMSTLMEAGSTPG